MFHISECRAKKYWVADKSIGLRPSLIKIANPGLQLKVLILFKSVALKKSLRCEPVAVYIWKKKANFMQIFQKDIHRGIKHSSMHMILSVYLEVYIPSVQKSESPKLY